MHFVCIQSVCPYDYRRKGANYRDYLRYIYNKNQALIKSIKYCLKKVIFLAAIGDKIQILFMDKSIGI